MRFIMTFDFQVPFSRMCLSIVVSQFIYILYYLGSRRNMISFTTFDQIKEGISAFVMVCMAGYLLYLLVEAPFSNILTEFVTKKRSKAKVETETKDKVGQSGRFAGSRGPVGKGLASQAEESNDFVKPDENANTFRGIVRKEIAEEKKIN